MAGKNFVGFGFGPIQAGVMLHEAQRAHGFATYTIGEVDETLVQAVRAAGGTVVIHIASRAGVRRAELRGLTLLNLTDTADRVEMGAAVRKADEIATALPSVRHYGQGGDLSVAGLLAVNAGRKPQVLYTCENDTRAAKALAVEITKLSGRLGALQILDTVIGKMSGVVAPEDRERLGLEPLAPGLEKAYLVEEFNRIYVSRIHIPGFSKVFPTFEEVADLAPFEEAKLYGHNAVHAALGYLAHLRGLRLMSEISNHADLLEFARAAFCEEVGPALIKRHAATGHALFTTEGFRIHAEDLLERMLRPALNDETARICRDPRRKLGYRDRLLGALRLGLEAGLQPRRLATGAAAALVQLAGPEVLSEPQRIEEALRSVWIGQELDAQADTCIGLITKAALNLARVPRAAGLLAI